MKASEDKNDDGMKDGKGSFGKRMAKFRKKGGGRGGKRGKKRGR